MKVTMKEHKKIRKIVTKNTEAKKGNSKQEKLPAWFDKDVDKVSPTEEEQVELEKILKELV